MEKTLESPLDYKEIKPVNPKGNQSWIFIGRTDAEAETPTFWLPDAKSWLILKDPDAGNDWGQEEKRTTEDEIVGWHKLQELVMDRETWHAVFRGGHKELDMTERLNQMSLVNIVNQWFSNFREHHSLQ